MNAVQPKQIPVLPAGDVATFQREFFDQRKPVILQGLAREWPAFGVWSLEHFKKTQGSMPVIVNTPPPDMYSPNPDKHLAALQGYVREKMSLADFVDILSTDPTTKKYLEALSIRKRLPTLWNDVKMPPYIPEKSLITSTLWVGPKATTTSLHYDVPHNTLVQLAGRKQITLFAPEEIGNLYPISWRSRLYPLSSSVNLSAPDLNRFPQFARATPYQLVLNAGDALFLPGCWWHEVHNLDITIAVNFWWRPPLRDWVDPTFLRLGVRGLATDVLKVIRARSEKKKVAGQAQA